MPLEKANLHLLDRFVTLDGSTIRELAGPARTAAQNQSLAEATVKPGGETAEHYHAKTEEIYSPRSEGCGEVRQSAQERVSPLFGVFQTALACAYRQVVEATALARC